MIEDVKRPEWVKSSIQTCNNIADQIVLAQETLRGLALRLNTHGIDTSPLVEGDHDLEHAWAHATSVRRSLRMMWPEVE